MNLEQLKRAFADNDCTAIYVKILASNDNSKNQVYFGGNFEALNIFPVSEITSGSSSSLQDAKLFKAKIDFSWTGEDGNLYPAPGAQFILYPQYPEVRFSGFLRGCANPPSFLLSSNRQEGRLLFLGVMAAGRIAGYITAADSELAKEFRGLNSLQVQGVFSVIELHSELSGRKVLFGKLREIYEQQWIDSKRLDRDGDIKPCTSPNCGGYTLEAELGIRPNGYSEPDFMGWEVKQFKVNKFELLNSSIITLMTPEPTGGAYVDRGVDYFLKTYGYPDSKTADRINFGGIHKNGTVCKKTGLILVLDGFDSSKQKITNANGKIALLDASGNEAASWSFSSMLKHWNRKHNQACYVPALHAKDTEGNRKYWYGREVITGTGTDFQLFLRQMAATNVYYDPGIKMEDASTSKPKIKRRSQFRIKSGCLAGLYINSNIVDIFENI